MEDDEQGKSALKTKASSKHHDDDDPCCERDPLNDIPWTIVFVTVVFVAMSIMLLYEMNARYRAERQCKKIVHTKPNGTRKSSRSNGQETEQGEFDLDAAND